MRIWVNRVESPSTQAGTSGTSRLDAQAPFVESQLMILDGVAHQLGQVEPLRMQHHFPSLDTRDVQQIRQDPGKVVDLPLDHAQGLSRCLAILGGHLQDLQAVADGGQGVPQFMGQHGQKGILAAVGFPKRFLGPLPLGDFRLQGLVAGCQGGSTFLHPALQISLELPQGLFRAFPLLDFALQLPGTAQGQGPGENRHQCEHGDPRGDRRQRLDHPGQAINGLEEDDGFEQVRETAGDDEGPEQPEHGGEG